jgi:hypothetical protein
VKRLPFAGYLSPVEHVTEVFCGLVMVLTFTLVAGHHVAEGREGTAALLRAALGCNFAWGIIDGVVYLMNRRYEHRRRFDRRDLFGASLCFLICVGTALPAAVPFLLFDTPAVALRVSNGILLASLFALGTVWARFVGASRLATGLLFLLLGFAMVAIAIVFGG